MAGLSRIVPALLALVAHPAFPASLSPEAGSFLFQHYPASVYGASPQNWAIAQDQRGLMYFGNTDGLLEYDGASWRKILLTNKSTVWSLAVDSHDTVFVGGQGEIGYLRPDSTRTLQYVSLLSRVPEADRQVGDVRGVFATPQGVFFCSSERLIRIRGMEDVKVWRPVSKFGYAFYIHGQLLVREKGKGLQSLRGDELSVVAGGDAFADQDIRAALEVPDGLLLDAGPGLYRLSGGHAAPVATDAESYLNENVVYNAMRSMPGGDIAIATRRGGLVLLNSAGGLERVIARSNGLPSDSVTAIYTDRQGNTWLALADGIVRFQSNLTALGQANGIHGNVVAIARQADALYTGTTVGLYRMSVAAPKEPVFEPVDTIKDAVLALLPLEDYLLAGGVHGLYRVTGTQASLAVPADLVFDITHSIRDRDVLYTAGSELLLLRRDGDGWKKSGVVKRAGQEFRSVAEDNNGRIWATTRVDIWRIDFRADPPKTERFDSSHGVPAGWKNVYRLGNSVVFATEKGLLQFSEQSRKFEPDLALGKQFADGSRAVSIAREGPGESVWITGQGYHGTLQWTSDAFEWFSMPLLRSGIEELYALWLDKDGVAWASGADGALFRSQPAKWWNPQAGFQVLLRRVQVSGDKAAVFGGASGESGPIRLPHRENALRFDFAAASFEDEPRLEYQVRLEGLDRDWSPWTGETRKDYTNLFERKYRFRVRARDGHGKITPEALFDFRVLAPWYRSWWAYTIYGTALGLLGWLLLRWRVRVLQAQNRKLENIVEERTAEVRRQRDQIQEEENKTEQLLLNILPAPVAAELRSTGSVAPLAFEDVTVCFTDFVGFTLSSEKLPAAKLVPILNEYFTAFDRIMDRYGLEKLKTIGDSYMFVSGIPEFRASHAVDAVLAALEIVETVKQLAVRDGNVVAWKVRAGLEAGPVVAGVVGVRKFAFDIWGDTVNFASRMESCGTAGRVNLSERMYRRVRDFIDCEPRGLVRTKEGREVEMYFALGLKPELVEGPLLDGMPVAYRNRYEQVFSNPPRAFPDLAVCETQT